MDLRDRSTLGDRRVHGTRSQSPAGSLREAAGGVPGADDGGQGLFIEDFTICRRWRANRRRGAPP